MACIHRGGTCLPYCCMYFKYMCDNILIDGKNIVYRACSVYFSPYNEEKSHPVTVIIRMMNKWKNIFKPDNWHVFWDVPKGTLWRKKAYSEYKEGRPDYSDEYRKMIKETQRFCLSVFNNMRVTQYIKKSQEADDLIYAFLKAYKDQNNLVISSDGDMPQILQKLNCKLHNPHYKNQKYVEKPEYDVVTIKALSGDKSDNIKKYRLVAEKTAMKIIDKGLEEFLEEKGRELFDFNTVLIDLDKNPYLEENMKYIKSIEFNEKFDLKKIKDLAVNNSISGLYSELMNIKSFKNT
jgi:5'-3' exonuclease